MKKFLKILLIILIAIVLIAGIYVAYVMLSFDRIADNTELDVDNACVTNDPAAVGQEYKLTSWNIGFAAYLQDYTFFMDGGTESRARSKEAVLENMDNITAELGNLASDFMFVQEADFDATRSYHVDEREILRDYFMQYSYVFAQNYDSPYLFYPFSNPHGANKAGLVTLTSYNITEAVRRSLPIQDSFAKVLDLDRCYSVVKMPTDSGKELVLINLHLSAYTTDPTICEQQINMIFDTIQEEYAKGNYVICGGDFNMDILGDSAGTFGVPMNDNASWCQPFPENEVPEHVSLIKPFDPEKKNPSCRNNDMPYTPGETFVCTIDGFLVTDNVEVISAEAVDEQFKYSDHNPVSLKFRLK